MLLSITPETQPRIDELFSDSGMKLVKICREHCASQTAHLTTILEQAKEKVCDFSNQVHADVWSRMANNMAALKNKSEVKIQKATAINEKAIFRWTDKGRKEKNDEEACGPLGTSKTAVPPFKAGAPSGANNSSTAKTSTTIRKAKKTTTTKTSTTLTSQRRKP